eukprot:6490473-Amphidinium_carterae.1
MSEDHESAVALDGSRDQASYVSTGRMTERQSFNLPSEVRGSRSRRPKRSLALIHLPTLRECEVMGRALGAASLTCAPVRVDPKTSMVATVGTTWERRITLGTLAGPKIATLDLSELTTKSRDSSRVAAYCIASSKSPAVAVTRMKSSA